VSFVSSHAYPRNPGVKTYIVKSGDTMWGIAQRFYGTGLMWQRIAAYNSVSDVRSMRAGTVLQLPSVT
jgi:nucleoid-associated protein YgaU